MALKTEELDSEDAIDLREECSEKSLRADKSIEDVETLDDEEV